MSFFKKLTEEFKELKANFADKPKEEEKKEEIRPEKPIESNNADTRQGGYGDQSLGQYSHGGSGDQSHAYGDHQAPSYGQQPYGQQPQYSGQPQSQQQYGASPSAYSGPPGQPPLPPGWIAQYDQSSQRWYFVEQTTGRTQWDPPSAPYSGYAPPPTGPSDPYAGGRGQNAGPGAYNQYGGSDHDQNAQQYYGDMKQTEEKSEKKASSDKKNMLLAGAGGLALGGVAGAVLARM